MSQQHTPGPWKLDEFASDLIVVGRPTWPCERDGEKGVWEVAQVNDLMGESREAFANACLILAAPDLLATLVEADEIIPPEDLAYLRSRIRAAIAKAKGGAS